MAAYGINQHKKGGGILDNFLKLFTYERHSGEKHSYSLAPAMYGKPTSFMGPGTRLDLRLNPDGTIKDNSLPLNHSDFESYIHDVAYDKAKKEYLKNPTPENKRQQLKKYGMLMMHLLMK